MTLSEMREEVWEQVAEPSDINPNNDTTKLDFALNQAQRRVAFWKDKGTGRRISFRNLESELFFKSVIVEGTLDEDAPSSTTITFPTGDVGTEDDRYNGWLLEIGSEKKLIVDYTGSTATATIHEAWDTNPSNGDSYTLMKRFWYLSGNSDPWVDDHINLPSATNRFRAEGNFFAILKIEDIEQQKTLDKAYAKDSFINNIFTPGDPNEWIRYGNRLYFDNAPDEEKWFRMEYYRAPTEMSADSDVPELPEPFHYAMVLWAIEWALRRRGESSEKWSVKQDFEDYMKSTVTELDVEWERESDAGILAMEEFS